MLSDWPGYDWNEVHSEPEKSIKCLIFISVKLHKR